jgi:triacylglycerol lipase
MTRQSLPTACIGVALAVLAAACHGGAAATSAPARATPSAPAGPPLDFGEVLDFARRTSAVYQDEAAIRAVVGPQPVLTVSNLARVDVRAFVEVDEAQRRQWVVVRGTANLMNAAEDADYAKVEAPDLGIVVHQGFHDDAEAVWTFARPLLKPGLETRITGHSLGGALALLIAMRLQTEGFPVGRIVTFGQPKVTNAKGVDRFRDLPLLRIVNHDDPVPLLPWETRGAAEEGFFRHLGAELWLTDRGTWEFFTESRAEKYLLTSFAAHVGRENPREHEMARYLAKIEALAAAPRSQAAR